ncbi:hypothetical protein J7E88_24810 [Streptomyces sp. ISL-10]|uniref:hypothetical protein n=1 Tax=Streptomyces sp. ISL-10 TaxID=2819172 RepID=UPI001BE7C586|nr:hypothetical protein [Streptomyces sp. ISL-10]MBT2368457.1 hypothetical protein [Streptomyces sp. ISL-10]
MGARPCAEGGGIADVLYDKRPFTGQLPVHRAAPVTWLRSEEKLPVNVGDASYDPHFRTAGGT